MARLRVAECPRLANKAAKAKCLGLTALVTAVAVMTPGCVRGFGPPSRPRPTRRNRCRRRGGDHFEWSRFCGAIHCARGPLRLVGSMYEVTPDETKVECEAGQQAAMARHCRGWGQGARTTGTTTTFHYRRLTGAGPAPVQ